MSENQIRVVITGVASDLRRALDGAKGDLGGLKAAIKDVPNKVKVDVQAQTALATERLKALKEQADGVREEIKIHADADTGVAEAKLRLLERQAHQTEEAIARAQLGSLIPSGGGAGAAGGGGGGVGKILGGIPGQGGGAGVGLAIAGAPLIAAGLGSATAIAGSAGAGLLGAGAIGTAGLGSLVAGIGPLVALSGGLKDAVKLSGQLDTAQKNLAAAQELYGAKSTQAASAQKALNKVMVEADPAVLAFAQSWGKVTETLDGAEQKVLPALTTALKPVLDTFEQLLPTLVQMAKIDLRGISAGLKPLLDFVGSATFKAALLDLSNTFARIAGPLGQALTSLLRAFLSVAVAASPYLVQIADALARWAKSFADSLAPGDHLNKLIASLVGQLRSWWELAKAVGEIMVTIFSAGASQGQGLVNSLTGVLNKWNAWLHTEAGQAGMKKFFQDSGDLLKAVLGFLAPIAKLIGSMSIGLIPVFTTLLTPLAKLLASISAWVTGISRDLPPVINALPGLAVAAGVLLSWMTLKSLVSTTATSLSGMAAGKVGLGRTAAPVVVGAPAAEGAASAGALSTGFAALQTGLVGVVGVAVAAGLVYGVARFLTKDARDAGKRFADAFTADLPQKVTNATKKGLAATADQTDLRQHVLQAQQNAAHNGPALAQRATQNALSAQGPDPALAAAFFNEGYSAGKAVVQGFQSVKFPTEFLVMRGIVEKLKALPPQARDEAAKVMISYATGLETHGKLPRGAVDRMIASLESQFPGLIAYLDRAGLNSAGAVAKHLDLTEARSKLRAALADMRSQWGDTLISTNITNQNINKNTAQAEDDLRAIIAHSHGKRHDEAVAALKNLERLNRDSYDRMLAQTETSVGAMQMAIRTGTGHAAQDAATNFAAVAGNIHAGMANGVLTVGQGGQLLAKELRDVLKAFGSATHIPDVAILTLTQAGLQGVSTGTSGRHLAAQGALIQVGQAGQRGRDTVPMSVGGQNIVVGAGEQVAVFNAEQQAVMNQRLGDMGGLPGMFARHNRPHYMAQGGLLGNIPAMIARANYDTSLHQPYLWGGGHGGFDNGPWDCSGAVSDILHAGGVLNAPRVSGDFMSYGLPGPGQVTLYANPTHVYMSIDGRFFGTSGSNPGGGAGWFAGAPRPGFAVRHIGGGGTGSFGQIAVPKVRGTGAIADMARAALGKETAAANQKLSGVVASAIGGSFGGGQPSENGPVEQQVFSYFSAQGFNKVAIAGMLGNASQESSMNPSAPGGGLWQQISNFGSGAPPLQVQMATMLPQILGLRAAMNAAGSPGEAARIFMDGFERPGIPALANRIAGANAAFAAGFAGGGPVGPRAATPTRPAKRPPAASKHKHPKTAAHHAPFIPKDALKGLLSPDQLRPDRMAAAYDRQVTVDDQRFTNLLAAQAVRAVDDPPLVTLTDADVAALDPAGTLGYQAGDQIANRDGMTVGRFFGPGGRVQGGSFHPGASTRMGQLAAILANRRSRLTSLYNEEGAERAAIGIDKHALARRQARKQRIERFLHQSVVRAGVVKSELDVLKSKNLAQALRDALSKQAIGKRLGGLRSHLRTVSAELTAERRHQAAEIPIARDPTHTQALEAQAAGLRDSIAVESELGRSGAGTVQKAQSAIFAHDLTKQLTGLEATNRTLGGQALSAGTGGLLGTLSGQMKTIGSDRDTRQNTLADFLQTQIIPARAEIASYVREQTDLGKLSNIQVRTPDTTAAAPGPDLAALNQLLQTQLATTRQDLAISQSQFEVLQGFAPLLEGRLVGSFASGVDFVPRTGMAIVHKGETILPDPAGPYGNRAAATVHTSQGPVEITILMGNNEAPLMKVIDARMNQRSLQVVSDHGGQRARLLSGVRRP